MNKLLLIALLLSPPALAETWILDRVIEYPVDSFVVDTGDSAVNMTGELTYTDGFVSLWIQACQTGICSDKETVLDNYLVIGLTPTTATLEDGSELQIISDYPGLILGTHLPGEGAFILKFH
tara:strand:- start:423 stop:788 length:366 start_codon:yes stop_codon:yes gene_type:complete